MKLNGLIPMLRVLRVDETIAFYRDLLGFNCVNQMEGWARLEKDGLEIMFATPNEHEPFDKPQFTGSLYFRIDDVDTLWKKLKDKTSIVYPIDNVDHGMREFAVRDNNGYCLQFGKETPHAKAGL